MSGAPSSVAASGGLSVVRGLRIAVAVLLIGGYPFLLLTGLSHTSPRTIGAALLGLALAAALLAGESAARLLPLLLRRFGILVAVAVAAAATNHPVALKLLPSLTNLWLLATFGATLRRGPSIVAQFATAMHDGFPDFLLPYCRSVTVMWCVVFAVNAVVGALLALAGPPQVWALYTGVFSYLAIALLGAGEYVFHKSRFRFYEDGWADGIWRRLCPPQRTALGRRTLEWQVARADDNARKMR